VEKALPQIRAQVTDSVEHHLLASASDHFGDSIPPADKERLKGELLAAIRDAVVPAYKRMADYMEQDYLPACREEIGIYALPNGKERYKIIARRYTTTNQTPEEISEIGKRELARVHDEMRAVMKQVGFEGTIQAFADSLRRDKRFYYDNADSLVAGFKEILHRMDQKMPELFGRLPQAHYGFREMETYRAESAPDAYYYPAPEDRSRTAFFYINTYKPEMRPKYTMEALAYHEAVPGHHMQIALQQELEQLPMFRQHGGYTAFVEGWALYSEELPKEVGFYADPYSEFGRLTFDAWRCTRLVVDPGIHYFGWTRDQAVAFFRENTALSELNIQSEVDRYIAWPGQALAYKIGQLKLLELRHRAEDALGDAFDLRAFHDALLEEGALPLDLLEAKMARWIDDQQATE
jgi:prolyl oligopeptidase